MALDSRFKDPTLVSGVGILIAIMTKKWNRKVINKYLKLDEVNASDLL